MSWILSGRRNPTELLFRWEETALNVGVELWNAGLQAEGVEVLGTQIPVIVATEEDREFSAKVEGSDETVRSPTVPRRWTKPW
jgi:carbamoylphosphate synthase large subunit